MSGSTTGATRKRPACSVSQEGASPETIPTASAKMVLRQPLHHFTGRGVVLSQDLMAEASSQLEPLSGLDLFERLWVLPEGRDLPRLMQASARDSAFAMVDVSICYRRPSHGDAPTTSAAFRQRGLLSVLFLNLGGLTQHGYDELCTWLHTPSVRDQVDVICPQETWRLSSEYLLPDWFWISSGSAPVSGQGIAVLVNRRFVSDQTIRFWEVQVGRILHVVVSLRRCGGLRSLDVVCVYVPSKVSESQSTYDKRDKSWTRLDRLLNSLPRRNMLYVAGDFNTDLHLAPPFVGVSYDVGPRKRSSAMSHDFSTCWLSISFVLSIHGDRRPRIGMRKVIPLRWISSLHAYPRPAPSAFMPFHMFAWHPGERRRAYLADLYPLMSGAWPPLHVVWA